MKTVIIIIAAILAMIFLFFVIGILVGYVVNERKWNGGKCPECGTKWEYWTTNSYGDRIYYCPNCMNSCTIVFDVDDKEEGGESC